MGVYRTNNGSQNVYIWKVSFTGWDGSSHYRCGTVTIVK